MEHTPEPPTDPRIAMVRTITSGRFRGPRGAFLTDRPDRLRALEAVLGDAIPEWWQKMAVAPESERMRYELRSFERFGVSNEVGLCAEMPRGACDTGIYGARPLRDVEGAQHRLRAILDEETPGLAFAAFCGDCVVCSKPWSWSRRGAVQCESAPIDAAGDITALFHVVELGRATRQQALQAASTLAGRVRWLPVIPSRWRPHSSVVRSLVPSIARPLTEHEPRLRGCVRLTERARLLFERAHVLALDGDPVGRALEALHDLGLSVHHVDDGVATIAFPIR